MIHFSEELSLFIGHLFVLTLRDRVELEVKLPKSSKVFVFLFSFVLQVPCKVAAACMQYFFTVHFVFLPLEAIQSYCHVTNVIGKGSTFLNTEMNMIIGWGKTF